MRLAAWALALLLSTLGIGLGTPAVSAAAVVTTLTGEPGEVLAIDAATAGTATRLGDLVIRESSSGEIAPPSESDGVISFTADSLFIDAPPSFSWQAGSGQVDVRRADDATLGCASLSATISVSSDVAVVSFTRRDLAARCVVTVGELRIIPDPSSLPAAAVRIPCRFTFGPAMGTCGWLAYVRSSGAAASLSAATTRSVTIWHEPVALRATLTGGPGGVALERSRDGVTWLATGTAVTTAADGSGATTIDPRDTWLYRFVFPGDATRAAATSNPVRVVVRYRAAQTPVHSTPRAIPRGTAVTFTTTVRPAGPGRPAPTVQFRLYRRSERVWRLASTRSVVATEAGVARTIIRLGARGDWYVRSQVLGTSLNATSYSTPIARYRVG